MPRDRGPGTPLLRMDIDTVSPSITTPTPSRIHLPSMSLRPNSGNLTPPPSGEKPRVRIDREYNSKELDSFPWLRLVPRTVGLPGGANLNQPFDFSSACEQCGAGAKPVPPLVARRCARSCARHRAHLGVLRRVGARRWPLGGRRSRNHRLPAGAPSIPASRGEEGLVRTARLHRGWPWFCLMAWMRSG